MTEINVTVSSPIPATPRAHQLRGMFDIPFKTESTLSWHGTIDLDFEWKIGLIVGPSGSGKTTIAKELFGDAIDRPLFWSAASVKSPKSVRMRSKNTSGGVRRNSLVSPATLM
jgi:ABC-type dipeptide/oligopeptide/nickel transport system ATPase component